MVRQDLCNSEPRWVLDKYITHSNEIDSRGNIWTISNSSDGYDDRIFLRKRVLDDSIMEITQEGKVISNTSFARIMKDSGLIGLLYGTFGARFNADPIHLNEVKPAISDSMYWKRDDLLISARHLSTIFLYRPSTGKIIWHKTGPWLNQHSVDYVGNHRISVFNNNMISGVPVESMFSSEDTVNGVSIFDFATNEVSEPYARLLAQSRPRSLTAGRAQVLSDGGLFIEDTEGGRHLRYAADRLMWSRVNDYDANHIGAVNWSRYLTANEVRAAVESINTKNCQPQAPK